MNNDTQEEEKVLNQSSAGSQNYHIVDADKPDFDIISTQSNFSIISSKYPRSDKAEQQPQLQDNIKQLQDSQEAKAKQFKDIFGVLQGDNGTIKIPVATNPSECWKFLTEQISIDPDDGKYFEPLFISPALDYDNSILKHVKEGDKELLVFEIDDKSGENLKKDFGGLVCHTFEVKLKEKHLEPPRIIDIDLHEMIDKWKKDPQYEFENTFDEKKRLVNMKVFKDGNKIFEKKIEQEQLQDEVKYRTSLVIQNRFSIQIRSYQKMTQQTVLIEDLCSRRVLHFTIKGDGINKDIGFLCTYDTKVNRQIKWSAKSTNYGLVRILTSGDQKKVTITGKLAFTRNPSQIISIACVMSMSKTSMRDMEHIMNPRYHIVILVFL